MPIVQVIFKRRLRAEGQAFAARAKDLYRGLSRAEKASSTIAVSKVKIDGQWVEVVAMNGGAKTSGVNKIRAAVQREGGIFMQAPGSGHPDSFLYNQLVGREGFQALGVSHWKGPCSELCRPFFQERSFFNVFWDSTFVR